MINFKLYKLKTRTDGQAEVPKILLIYTGGTLGMVFDHAKESLVPFGFEDILKFIPELKRLRLSLDIMAMEPAIDSSDMRPEVWQELVRLLKNNYEAYDGFVILHGTDTMAYTASALSFMMRNLSKPIILTGAQLPIGTPRTDARENMITALELSADQSPLREVCIYFNGRLIRGNRAKKYESSQFDAFHSENYPYLAEVGVYCQYNYPYLLKPSGKPLFTENLVTDVLVLKLFPGISSRYVSQILHLPDLKGIVIETFGSGNASSDPDFLKLLEEADARGIILVNISQCSGGEVRQKDYATGRGLLAAGVISGRDMTTEAAITKLMILLGMQMSNNEIKKAIGENLAGEMSMSN